MTVFGGFAKNESDTLAEPVRVLRGQGRQHRGAHADRAVAAKFPAGAGAAVVLHRQPEGAEGVQGRRGGGRRVTPLFTGTYAHRAPGRHRAVQVRTWDRGEQASSWSATTTTGATKAKLRQDDLPAHPRRDRRASRRSQAGTIDGFDFADPADWTPSRGRRSTSSSAAPFNIVYLGINQKPATRSSQNLKVRQAIAYAINREQLVKSKLPEGAKVADAFMPDDRRRLHRGRHQVRLQPRQGQAAARRGRARRT